MMTISKNVEGLLLKASILSLITSPLTLFCNKQNTQPKETAPQVMMEKDSKFQIGGNYTYVTLKPSDHRTFHGSLGGMQAMYEYQPMNRFYGGGKFTWREGQTRGGAGKRSLLIFDVQERLGYTYAPEKKDWFLTLFSGFGYRHIGHRFHPKSGSSIRFNYNEFYIPVGMLTNYDITHCFSIGLNYIWMPQVYPTVSIKPLKGARWTTKNTVTNFYAELPMTYKFMDDKRYSVIVNPFYEHWRDGRTTAKLSNGTTLGLPSNTYNFYGIEINFAYDF